MWVSLSVDAVKILSVTDTSSGIDIVTYVALSTNSVLSIDAFAKAVLVNINKQCKKMLSMHVIGRHQSW
jgi:hypothetical protein